MPFKDKAKQRQANKTSYQRRKERNVCFQCAGPRDDPTKSCCAECREIRRVKQKEYTRKLRARCLEAYGGAVCACCGETENTFLTIDHINGGGRQHFKEIKGSGRSFYTWLKAHDFPKGFQILCFNCNSGRHINGGVCPHQV